jgi:hypothetical protein
LWGLDGESGPIYIRMRGASCWLLVVRGSWLGWGGWVMRVNVGWQWRAGEEVSGLGERRGSGDGEEGGDSGEASSLERELSEEERARGRGLSQ